MVASQASRQERLPSFVAWQKPPSQILHRPPILGAPLLPRSPKAGARLMRTVRFALFLLALCAAAPVLAPWQPAQAADVICYNCPPEWADWASMLKAIKTDLHYDIPHDNKNSGQALAQILAEKSNPA